MRSVQPLNEQPSGKRQLAVKTQSFKAGLYGDKVLPADIACSLAQRNSCELKETVFKEESTTC